jgi:hypothetical protein
MFAYSFDLYNDGEFVTNVVLHAPDRIAAWARLASYMDMYDKAHLVASRVL